MVKILSKSGDSLADQYDVVGSVAGIEELQSREVSLVHDMAPVLFSERLSASVRRITTGDLNQSTSFDISITDLPRGITRIPIVTVRKDVAARLTNCTVALQQADQIREIPLFIWDSGEGEVTAPIVDNGAAVTDFTFMLNALQGSLPATVVGDFQPRVMNRLTFRGVTSAFGAGTVEVIMLAHILFTHLGGNVPANRGLTVPSW